MNLTAKLVLPHRDPLSARVALSRSPRPAPPPASRSRLLVTDRGLAGLPVTARVLDLIEAAGLGRAMFSDVDPNPNEKNMEAGIAAYRAGGHDGVIAFGGGSGLDLGKMVAFMQGQTRPVWDFEDIGDWWTRANSRHRRADRGGADDRWHRVRGRPCFCHHQ